MRVPGARGPDLPDRPLFGPVIGPAITHALIVWTAFLAVLVLHHLGACPTHAPFH